MTSDVLNVLQAWLWKKSLEGRISAKKLWWFLDTIKDSNNATFDVDARKHTTQLAWRSKAFLVSS